MTGGETTPAGGTVRYGQSYPTQEGPHRLGPLEPFNREVDGRFRPSLRVRCQCGWRVIGRSVQAREVNQAAVDHVCGLIDTPHTTGFLPVLDLTQSGQQR